MTRYPNKSFASVQLFSKLSPEKCPVYMNQGVQRRMVLVVIFSYFRNYFFFALLLLLYDLVHDVETMQGQY